VDGETVYLRLPVPLQHAACTAIGWRTKRTRYASPFPELLAEAEERLRWSLDEVLRYRDERLRQFVAHAAETVPFYHARFAQLGIDPAEIRSLDDLRSLPILTKPEAQEHVHELVSSAVSDSKRIFAHTSGTTGGALRFPVTMRSIQEQWVVYWRYRRSHGIDLGTWCGYFGGRSVVPATQDTPPYWRYNLVGKQILFSGYHMSPRALPQYVAELRRRRPPWLFGYPSLLVILAGHLLETGADLGYQVRWITIGAESLLDHQADLIERAFGVRPLQHYGMTEAVANISQCERGALHVDEDFAPVEFVPVEDTGFSRVVGTNYTNPATPLLRYAMEDLVTFDTGVGCTCGRPGRVVASLDGRVEDYVVLRNGAKIGRMDHIFKDMVNVKEAQIHQQRAGEVTIRVVRGGAYTDADETALRREAQKRLGSDTEIRVSYVDQLPRTRTGKLRLVVSEVEGAAVSAQRL
jgi:phenylacetate-CoA ligase